MALSAPELLELGNLSQDLIILRSRFGADAEKVEAFFLDLKDRIVSEKDSSVRTALMQIPTALFYEVIRGQRDFKWYSPSTYDITKSMRALSDDFAKTFGFERYKKLRKL